MLESLLPQIGLAAGASVASGLRFYGTVAALGLLHRLGVLHLPAGLQVLSEVPIIVLASALYAVEFVADKIPAVDTVWDAIHTFIRVPAAAVLGFAAFGNVAEPWRIAAALLCGTVALSSHGIKASSRLAINASPEPFSNWTASLAEDLLTGVLIWLAVSHPMVALAIAAAVVLAAALLPAPRSDWSGGSLVRPGGRGRLRKREAEASPVSYQSAALNRRGPTECGDVRHARVKSSVGQN